MQRCEVSPGRGVSLGWKPLRGGSPDIPFRAMEKAIEYAASEDTCRHVSEGLMHSACQSQAKCYILTRKREILRPTDPPLWGTVQGA
jgi:hypothetical protein